MGTIRSRALALVALVLVGYPLVSLLRSVFVSTSGPVGAWHAVASRTVSIALMHTVVVSGLATVVATILGVLMALLVAKSDLPFRRWFACVWVAPLVVPAYVTGLAWLDTYTRAGLSDEMFHVSANWLSGAAGVVVLLALQGAPLAYLVVFVALRSGSISELEDAARSAGRSPSGVLRDVTLPLVRSAIIGAMFLVFVSSASDFGIPAVLAIPAGFSTVTTLIYSDLSFAGGADALSSAASLSALLGIVAIVLVFVTNRISRVGLVGGRAGGQTVSARPLLALGRWRALVSFACWAFFLLATVGPFAGLLVTSVSPAFRMTPWPGDWVGSAYAAALSGDNLAALVRSILLAGGAALVVAVGGAVVALMLRRGDRLASASNTLFSLPFALPGSVVAIAVLIAWQRWLYGTMLIILVAYVARFAVVGIRTSVATLGGLSDDLVDAARASGATARRATFDIVRPAMTPGILISFALVFLLGTHELTMSSLLYGPSTKTFAVQVLAAEEAGSVALTAALAMLITVITVVLAGIVLGTRAGRRIISSGFEI